MGYFVSRLLLGLLFVACVNDDEPMPPPPPTEPVVPACVGCGPVESPPPSASCTQFPSDCCCSSPGEGGTYVYCTGGACP